VCLRSLAARSDENFLHTSSRACMLNIKTSVHLMSEFFIEYVEGTWTYFYYSFDALSPIYFIKK